jgi:hypothetical protein
MKTTKVTNPKPELHVHDVTKLQGRLKAIGGSMSDDWNNILANQTIQTLWLKNSTAEEVRRQRHAAIDALMGMGPRDEFEGMAAAQLIACHNASMECYRRAMIGEQTFEGRRENLTQANKLSRTYAALLEALNRHRGKGHQKVTVEHVHVHAGGRAIVGNVERPGGGCPAKSEEQPHALGYAPGATMPSPNTSRESLPVAGNEERPMPDARRNVAGGSERKQERP